jgi:hypothetical protein
MCSAIDYRDEQCASLILLIPSFIHLNILFTQAIFSKNIKTAAMTTIKRKESTQIDHGVY